MNRKYMDAELKKAASHLAKLTHKGSFLRGNIVTMKRVCGYPNCKCAVEGKKHVSMYIGKKQDATTKMIYIPKRLEEEIRGKLEAYQKIKKLTERISEMNYKELEIEKSGDV